VYAIAFYTGDVTIVDTTTAPQFNYSFVDGFQVLNYSLVPLAIRPPGSTGQVFADQGILDSIVTYQSLSDLPPQTAQIYSYEGIPVTNYLPTYWVSVGSVSDNIPAGTHLYDRPPLYDPHPLTVNVSGPSASVLEGDTATFTISLSQSSTSSVTVNYTTADGTALAGTDYTAKTDSVTFAPGDLTKTVPVPVLYDPDADAAENPPDQSSSSETFQLKLTSASGATIGTGSATATIKEVALFTTGADKVDFNNLEPDQVAAITNGADLYHSLGGADKVWLPADGTILASGIKWDSTHVFSIGGPNSSPGNAGATVHSGPSNDLIDGAYEGNAQFGGAPNQVGYVTFTNGDTVAYTGSFKDYTITELTGGYLEVKDNRGIDGTDILKDVAFLKFDGDGTTIPAPGRELQTVSHASAKSWLASASRAGKPNVQAEALSLIDLGGNTRWAAGPGTNHTITWSMLTDPSKLPADYLRNSGDGVNSLTPLTPKQWKTVHTAIAQIFTNIQKFLPDVKFQEVKENSADSAASALGLGDVGTIRFLGFGAIPPRYDPSLGVDKKISGEAWRPSDLVEADSMLGDIVLNSSILSTPNAFLVGQPGYITLEHEIGHALGLGDVTAAMTPSAPTIMDQAPYPRVRDYSAADQLALKALYGAGGTTEISSTGSVIGTPPADSSTNPTASNRGTTITNPTTPWDSALQWLEPHVTSILSDLQDFKHGDSFTQLLNQIENWNSPPGSAPSHKTATSQVAAVSQSQVGDTLFNLSSLVHASASFGSSPSSANTVITIPMSDSNAQPFLASNANQHS
jgi:hypothetical protein